MNALCRLTALLVFILLAPGLMEAAAATAGETAEAKAALEAAHAAYRQAGAFRETFEFVLELPDGHRESKKQEYGVGKDGEAFLAPADGRSCGSSRGKGG